MQMTTEAKGTEDGLARRRAGRKGQVPKPEQQLFACFIPSFAPHVCLCARLAGNREVHRLCGTHVLVGVKQRNTRKQI